METTDLYKKGDTITVSKWDITKTITVDKAVFKRLKRWIELWVFDTTWEYYVLESALIERV